MSSTLVKKVSKKKGVNVNGREGERGVALVMTLMLTTLLLAAAGALILTTSISATNAVDSTPETQAYYAAESGIQTTLNVLRGNVSPSISYRTAVTPSTSNKSGDSATTASPAYARLSNWLSYDGTYTDRVIIYPRTNYTPLTGTAFSAVLSDPDNSSVVSFTTTGTFDSTGTSSYVAGQGNNKVTIAYSSIGATLSAYPAIATNLGTFNISTNGTGAAIPPGGIGFTLTINMTAPWQGTMDLKCTLTGTASNSSSTIGVAFPNQAASVEGATFTLVSNPLQLAAPNSNSGNTPVQANLLAPEPRRLLIRVTGYGPSGAKKQMQTLANKFALDYSPRATSVIRGADDGTTMTFNPGSSAAYTYSGADNGSSQTTIGGFAVTNTNDYNKITSLISTGQVSGNPAVVQMAVSNLPSWLQTADAARTLLNRMQAIAQYQGRYFTTANPPTSYGTTSSPVLTFVDGNATLPNGGGAGLLVVTGTLTLDGGTPYDGLVLVLGDGIVARNGGGNGNTLGALVVGRFVRSTPGGAFLAPTFNGNGSGTSNLQFDSGWVFKAQNLTGRRIMGVSEY